MGRSNPGYLKFLNWNVSTKKQVPRNDYFFLYIELKKWVFQAHRRVSPTTGVGIYGNVKDLWRKWRNAYGKSEEFDWKGENNLYGKESVWQNMVNWRICMETCRLVIGKWRIYMEKSWICLETWKKLNGKNMEKWGICIEMWRIY